MLAEGFESYNSTPMEDTNFGKIGVVFLEKDILFSTHIQHSNKHANIIILKFGIWPFPERLGKSSEEQLIFREVNIQLVDF